MLNKPSPAAIYCQNPTSCKSSLVPVSHLISASKKLFLLSFKDTFSLSRSFGTIIMLRIGCPFRSLNTFNVLSRQLVRKYYFIVVTALWLIHRDYISQAPIVLPRMLKKLKFWTILKKKDILRDWKSCHCSRKQRYIIIEKNKNSDLFYNFYFFAIYTGPFLLMLFWGNSVFVNLILTGNVFPSCLVTYLHALF